MTTVIRIGPQGGKITKDEGGKKTYLGKDSPAGRAGPMTAAGVKTLSDLRRFASDMKGADLYTHAVRHDGEIDSILKMGLGVEGRTTFTTPTIKPSGHSPGANPDYAMSYDYVRDRGAGYVVVKATGGKDSTDMVERGLQYPETQFKGKIPPSNIAKVVRMVTDSTGSRIREDHLAEFALDNQGLSDEEVKSLPPKYQRWFSLGNGEVSKGGKVIRIGVRGGKITADRGGKLEYQGKDVPGVKQGRVVTLVAGKMAGTEYAVDDEGNDKLVKVHGVPVVPANKLLWTSATPEGEGTGLVAIQRDRKGKNQYIYNEAHWAKVNAEKWGRMQAALEDIDAIRSGIARGQRGLSDKLKQNFDVLALVDSTGLRPGFGASDMAEAWSYGAGTLLAKHVKQRGGKVYLDFVGKHGVSHSREILDPKVAKMLLRRRKEAKEAGGKDMRLFPSVRSSTLASALDSVSPKGRHYKVKDLRTLKGTATAALAIKGQRMPRTDKELAKAKREVAKEVASVLGNTHAVALKSYIAPFVFDRWEASASRKRKAS